MTKNFYEDGAPSGPWATAAQSPRGEFGVAFGCGPVQIDFVTEDRLEAFIAAARKVGEGADLLALVIDAAKAVPGLKATIRQREKAACN